MRRDVVSGLLLTSVLAVGGCGSSASTAKNTNPSGATNAASLRLSASAGVAYAKEVNVRASDVPGAEVVRAERVSPPPKPQEFAMARCAGAPSPASRVVGVDSASLRPRAQGLVSVKSSVNVFPSAAVATQELATTTSARGLACAARLLPRSLSRSSGRVRFGHIGISALPNLLGTGRVRSSGARVVTTVTGTTALGETRTVRLYTDVLAIPVGRSEVNLTLTGLSGPPELAIERRLLSTLAARAEAHPL